MIPAAFRVLKMMPAKTTEDSAEPTSASSPNIRFLTEKSKNGEHKWTRTDVNFWLDVLLGVVFLGLVSVSTIIRFVFPRAIDSTDWSLWSLSYDDWSQVQFALVAVLSVLILVHIMLHWNWVCSVVQQRVLHSTNRKPDDGWQTIIGVGLMIVILNLLGIVLGLAMLMVVRAV